MSTQLHPLTRQRLDQYQQRRAVLLWLRGISAIVVTLILGVLLVVLVDAFWVVSDSLRWLLSGAAYVSAALVAWWMCLRPSVRKPGEDHLALSIESSQPELREQLLAAIELGRASDKDLSIGSPTFRRLLQDHVGKQMEGLDIRKLLPAKLIQRWILYAVLVVLLCVGLSFIPGLSLPHRLARALFPGANLSRLSSVKVEVVRPEPASQPVPQDETIAIEVAVENLGNGKVWLETSSASTAAESRPMQSGQPDRFIANVAVAHETIEYRVFAGDAVTQRYWLEPRPRPHAKSFKKNFHYPAYSRLADSTTTEETGDLVALAGSEVVMTVEVDQPVREARLDVIQAGSGTLRSMPMQPVDETHWQVSLQLNRPSEYRLYLVSKETGFDNPISPRYLIRPEEDLPPRIDFVGITEWTQLVPATEVFGLEAKAEDELPLARIEQLYSINGAGWKKVAQPVSTEKVVDLQWDWDLLPLQVKVGDIVRTKLLATDLKGQTGESQLLELVISSADFDPQRHQLIALRCSLSPRLEALTKLAEQHQKSAETISQTLKPESNPQDFQQARTKLTEWAKEIADQAMAIRLAAVQIERVVEEVEDARELELVGRLLARIELDWMNTVQALQAEDWLANDKEQIRQDLDRTRTAFNQAADAARWLEIDYRTFVSHDVVVGIARDIQSLKSHLQLIDAENRRTDWTRLSRHQTVTLRQIRSIQKFIQQHRPAVREATAGAMDRQFTRLEVRAVPLEEKLAGEANVSELNRLYQELQGDLASQGTFDSLDHDLRWKMNERRRDLEGRASMLFYPLRETAQAVRTSVDHQKNAATSQTADSETFQAKAQRLWNELVHVQQPRLAQFEVRRQGLQANKACEPMLASDIGLADRALRAVLGRLQSPDTTRDSVAEDMKAIAEAFGVLEAGHEVVDVGFRLEALHRAEQFDSQTEGAGFTGPRNWEAIKERFETVGRVLREGGFSNEINDAFNPVRWAPEVGQASGKFDLRYNKVSGWPAASDELQVIVRHTQTIRAKIQPVMEEARRKLAALAPSLPELAKQAAEKFEQLSEKSEEQAQEAAKSEAVVDAAEALKEEQEAAEEALEKLVDALVDQANTQDLTTPQGREVARQSDQSLAALKEQNEDVQQAMEQAEQAAEAAEQAQELQQAASKQEQFAEMLAKVGEQMEQLAQNQSATDPQQNADPQAMAQQQADSPQADSPEAQTLAEQYAQAEKLSQLANMDKEAMLKRLEEELQRNEAMQQALSEIAENAAKEVQATLQVAQQKEDDLRRDLEKADSAFQEQKRQLAEKVQDLAKKTDQLKDQTLDRAERAAQMAEQQAPQKQLNEIRQELSPAAAQARDANEHQAAEDLKEKAKQLAEQLQQAAKEAREEAQKLAEAAQQDIAKNPRELENKRRDAESFQKRIRDEEVREAEADLREAKNRKSSAEQQARAAQNQEKEAQRRVEQAQKAADEQKDSQERQRNLENAQDQLAQAKKQVAVTEQRKADADQQIQQREEQRKQAQAKETPELKAKNPAAELAQRLAQQAAEKAEQLAKTAAELAKAQDWQQQLQPTADPLANAANQQAAVQKDVAQAAQDLARASRHEQRLGNRDAAMQLGEQAQGVQETAAQELQQSAEKLADAGQDAKAGRPSAPADAAKSQAAKQSVEASEQALGENLAALGEMLAANEANKSAAENAAEGTAEANAGSEQATTPAGQQPSSPPASQSQAAKPSGAQPPESQGSPSSPSPSSPSSAGNPPPTPSSNSPAAPPASQEMPSGSPSKPGQKDNLFAASPQEKAKLMAQLLDELDRQLTQAAAAENSQDASQPSNQPPTPGTLANAAQALAQEMRQQRQEASEQMQQSMQDSTSKESQFANSAAATAGEFKVLSRDRTDDQWGKLRNQSAEDLAEGGREVISPEYRRLLEVYYRVLAEQAK